VPWDVELGVPTLASLGFRNLYAKTKNENTLIQNHGFYVSFKNEILSSFQS
jgi:hypothetical protein